MKMERHIVIADKDHGLPYSKGLMASSLMVTGLPGPTAFRTAERIESILKESDRYSVSGDDLKDLATTLLAEEGKRYAEIYTKWQQVQELDMPLILLLGGGTGVGKSIAATQLAARLGISRVISTDAVREVLRSAISRDIMPTLHESSFEAGDAMTVVPKGTDPLMLGFQEQVSAVAVGIRALINRAIEEGTDMIIEGAHLVPGFIDPTEAIDVAVLVPVVIRVEDEQLHRSHLHVRGVESSSSRHGRYLASFDKIREIHEYISRAAVEHGVAVVDSYDLDSTLQEIIAIVIEHALATAHRWERDMKGAGSSPTHPPRKAKGRTSRTPSVVGKRRRN